MDYNHRRDNHRYDRLGWLYDKFKRNVNKKRWKGDSLSIVLFYTLFIFSHPFPPSKKEKRKNPFSFWQYLFSVFVEAPPCSGICSEVNTLRQRTVFRDPRNAEFNAVIEQLFCTSSYRLNLCIVAGVHFISEN